MNDRDRLEEALTTLGEVLTERGLRYELLVIGGSTLLILGLIDRPTADIDVIGVVTADGYGRLDELPEPFVAAARDVGDALGLGDRWVNTGPAGLLDFGLPPGLAERVDVRQYGGLVLHLPARRDLIAFKLYAAADQGERSKHFQDLQALAPTTVELLDAARWTRTHDPSPGFLAVLRPILAGFDVEFDGAG